LPATKNTVSATMRLPSFDYTAITASEIPTFTLRQY